MVKGVISWRAHHELFSTIVWDESNRSVHEEKRAYPSFQSAFTLDWTRIKKRKDVRHRDNPDRFQALVARKIRSVEVVHFVVYSKVDGNLELISIRIANEKEHYAFYL